MKVYFFYGEHFLSRKLKYKKTFTIACSFIVNKLRATDSSICPGLINEVDIIYISVPWFRFTLMDLAPRVLFHQFQIIFDRIRLTFSVAIGTKSTNEIKYSPGITAVLGDRAHEHIK